jgi:hypothetical protein
LLSAQLALSGPQILERNTNVPVSQDAQGNPNPATQEDEMQISINPTNPLNVVGFTHNLRNANEIQLFASLDGGKTWARQVITNSSGPNPNGGTNIDDGQGTVQLRGDPTVAFDANGNLFVGYGIQNSGTLSGFDKFIVGREDSLGQFSFFTVVAERGLDNPHLATGLDPVTGSQAVYITYSRNLLGHIAISGFRFGIDAGFTAPLNVDTVPDLFVNNSGPAVGPNGELYVTWDGFGFSQKAIFVASKLTGLFGAGSFSADVLVRNVNFQMLQPPASGRGFTPYPSIVVDRSGGAFNGRVYIAFTDLVSGNNTDIFLTRSDDNGVTWSNLGTFGNVEASVSTSFLATAAVDPNTGAVSVAYYTTDGAPDDTQVNLRVASSSDGGGTFAKTNVTTAPSSSAHLNNQASGLLDYIGLDARNGTLQAFWTDNRGFGTGFNNAHGFTASVSIVGARAGNQLLVSGDGTILLRNDPANADFLDVLVGSQLQWVGLLNSVGSVVVTPGNTHAVDIENMVPETVTDLPVTVNMVHGDDTVTVGTTFPPVNFTGGGTVNLGSGNDRVGVLATSGPMTINGSGHDEVFVSHLASILGPLTINNANSAASVTILDSGDTSDQPNVVLTATSLTGLTGPAAPINFGANSLGDLTIFGGQANNTWTVADTVPSAAPGGSQTFLFLNGQTDTVNVQGIEATDPLTVKTIGVNNRVAHVGNAGTLSGLHGALSFASQTPGPSIQVNVDDAADNATHPNVQLTATSLTGLAPAAINFAPKSVASLTITVGNGNNTYTVANTPSAPVLLNTGNGDDTVNIQGIAFGSALTVVAGGRGNDRAFVGNNGSVSGLNGTVTLNNPTSFSHVTIDDSAGTADHLNVQLTATRLTGLAADIFFGANSLNGLTINGGKGTDNFVVVTTPASQAPGGNPTVLTADGANHHDPTTFPALVLVLATDRTAPLTVQNGSRDMAVLAGAAFLNGREVGNRVLSGLQSPLTIANTSGAGYSVFLEDEADSVSHPNVLLTDTSLTGLTGPAVPINFVANPRTGRRVDTLVLAVGTGTNTYTIDQSTAFSGPFASDTVLFTGGANTTVNVQGSGANELLEVLNVDVNDPRESVLANAVVNVGKGNQLTGIPGRLSLAGGQVHINDGADNSDHADVRLANGSLSGLTPVPIALQALSGPTITVGDGKNQYTIANAFGPAPGGPPFPAPGDPPFTPPARPTILNTGNGDDTVTILGTDSVSPLIVNAGGKGNDVITVGNNHSLAGIKGALTLNNRPRFSKVIIDGGADTDSHPNVQLTPTSLTGLMADINFGPNSLAGLTITGGKGNNTYTVIDTIFSGVGDPTLLNTGDGNDTVFVRRTDKFAPLTIQAGAGTDTINIGTTTNTLDLLDGTITVKGGTGVDTLNINDQGSTTPHTYQQTLTTLDRSGAARITFLGIANVNINKGPVLGPMLTGLSFPSSIQAGQVATLKGRLVDPDPRARLTLRVTWGDGSQPETIRPGQEPFTLQHRYGKAGKYTVHLVWFDAQGHTNSEELSLDVI